MSGAMLSQEEINALLNGMSSETSNEEPMITDDSDVLSAEQIDALGEIGNISMGTAATTLFALLNNKVMITTPEVQLMTVEELKKLIDHDTVAIAVDYTIGLQGSNVLMLGEENVKIIADLMMGGTGEYAKGELSDLHLSAIAEAMNQMIGSASTSMSQMFNKKIDISPPQALELGKNPDIITKLLNTEEKVAKISFRLQVADNLIDSELMQVIPVSFAKELVGHLFEGNASDSNYSEEQKTSSHSEVVSPVTEVIHNQPIQQASTPINAQPVQYNKPVYSEPVNVQRAEFQSFSGDTNYSVPGNMGVLMDVALEVSVELGRTSKKIKEITEFGPGTVLELDRLVGEPIDVLVNGKYIAKGEVVVIDENFGIRITDIISPENRL